MTRAVTSRPGHVLVQVPATLHAGVSAAVAERDAALAAAAAGDRDGLDRRLIDDVIDLFAKTGDPFSANDVRIHLADTDVRASLIGSRFMAASRGRRIRQLGWVTSTKPNTHCKPVGLWKGVA